MVFQCINISQVPWEVLKTEAEGRDLANVNAWKTMFDPYNTKFGLPTPAGHTQRYAWDNITDRGLIARL